MYVYIMTNKNNTTFYIGVTNDLIRRVYEHKQLMVQGFTKKYQLTKLVFFEECGLPMVAIEREKQLKKCFTREEKIKLIEEFNPNFKDLYDEIV